MKALLIILALSLALPCAAAEYVVKTKDFTVYSTDDVIVQETVTVEQTEDYTLRYVNRTLAATNAAITDLQAKKAELEAIKVILDDKVKGVKLKEKELAPE